MAKTPAEIRSLARSHTETAINTLAGILTAPKAKDSDKIAAANSLMDRGWGKATQILAGDEDNGPIVVTWQKK